MYSVWPIDQIINIHFMVYRAVLINVYYVAYGSVLINAQHMAYRSNYQS